MMDLEVILPIQDQAPLGVRDLEDRQGVQDHILVVTLLPMKIEVAAHKTAPQQCLRINSESVVVGSVKKQMMLIVPKFSPVLIFIRFHRT